VLKGCNHYDLIVLRPRWSEVIETLKKKSGHTSYNSTQDVTGCI